MTKDEAIVIIANDIDFLEMVINWEGIDGAEQLIEALNVIVREGQV